MKEENAGELREFAAVKQAVQMGVKAGIYSMEDVVVLHQCLNRLGSILKETTKPSTPEKTPPAKPEKKLAKVDGKK